jgi:hypothetical protein
MSFPSVVYIIRHCDKDEDSGDFCSATGYKRANALAGFTGACVESYHCNNACEGTFAHSGFFPALLEGQTPVLLAAVSKSENKECTHSNRHCLILNPLAARYHVQINPNGESFCASDRGAEQMAQYVLGHPELYGGRVVIIAFEHEAIPALVNAFGVEPPMASKWPKSLKDRFDFVFGITFATAHPQLTITSQNLLPGDGGAWPSSTSSSALASANPAHTSIFFWIVVFAILAVAMFVILRLLHR